MHSDISSGGVRRKTIFREAGMLVVCVLLALTGCAVSNKGQQQSLSAAEESVYSVHQDGALAYWYIDDHQLPPVFRPSPVQWLAVSHHRPPVFDLANGSGVGSQPLSIPSSPGYISEFELVLLFATGKAVPLPGYRFTPETISMLKGAQEILIEGHADITGTSAFNLKLSERRAMGVKKLLISQKINPDVIRMVAKGSTTPIADNSTVEGRRQNRRVVVRIQEENAG